MKSDGIRSTGFRTDRLWKLRRTLPFLIHLGPLRHSPDCPPTIPHWAEKGHARRKRVGPSRPDLGCPPTQALAVNFPVGGHGPGAIAKQGGQASGPQKEEPGCLPLFPARFSSLAAYWNHARSFKISCCLAPTSKSFLCVWGGLPGHWDSFSKLIRWFQCTVQAVNHCLQLSK